MTGSTISGNSATGDGGGIFTFDAGEVTVTGSTISNNTAGDDGGGIFSDTNLSSQTTVITNSTISGNTAGDSGGGIFNLDGLTRIVSSTVTGNQAAMGGGVSSFDDNGTSTEVSSTIIAGNTATTDGAGSDVASQSGTNTTSSFVSQGFNLIGDGQHASVDFFSVTNPDNDLVGTTANPLDPRLGDLADNGGPTQTHALLLDSPAIDADNSALSTDGRGLVRAVDFEFVANASNGSDIGAFELQTTDPLSIPLVVASASGLADGNITPGELSLREAIELANLLSGADTITFDSSLSGQTITLAGTELAISESLTIDANDLTGGLTIDGVNASRLLNFTAITGDLTVRGLELVRGEADGNGGAILFGSNGDLRVENSLSLIHI